MRCLNKMCVQEIILQLQDIYKILSSHKANFLAKDCRFMCCTIVNNEHLQMNVTISKFPFELC